MKRKLLIPLLMIFVLSSQIVIGNVSMDSVAHVNIKKGWKELTDVATIQFPKNVKFRNDSGKNLTDVIKKGDKVSIKLGYNDELNEEFVGYVSLIEQTIPIKITCEDEMYTLKRSTVTKSWKSASLKDVISYIAPSYTINTEDVNLGPFSIDKESPAHVLKRLAKYGLVSFFKDKTLTVRFPYRFTPQETVYVYDFQKNVADNSLEYRTKEDMKIKIKAISNLKNGKKIIVTVGDEDGATETRNFGEMSEANLRNLANAALETNKFDGYTGDITGFGLPLVNPTDVVAFRDNNFLDRKGRYFIDAVEIDFGVNGYRRKSTPGKKST